MGSIELRLRVKPVFRRSLETKAMQFGHTFSLSSSSLASCSFSSLSLS